LGNGWHGWMLHRHASTLQLAAQSVPHSKLSTPAGFWLLLYLRELKPRNRHDCLRYFPICVGGQVSNRRPHVVSTGVTAVHGEDGGSVPEYQISVHEANPWTARCIRSREAVYRVMRSDPAVSSSLVPINAAFRIPHSIPIRVIAIIAGLAGRWPWNARS